MEIDPAILEKEESKGWSVVTPFITKQGTPAVLINWAFYDPSNRDINEIARLTMYRAHKIMRDYPPGKDKKYLLIFDPIGSSWKNFDRLYWKTIGPLAAENLPETLLCSVVVRANWAIQLAFKFAKHFIDPHTVKKVRIVPNDPVKIKEALLEFFDEDELWDFWGGKKQWKPKNYGALMSFVGKKNDDEQEQSEIEKNMAKEINELEQQEQTDG